MKGRSQRSRPVLDPPAHLRPLLGLGHTHAARVAPQPADLSRKASAAVWMRMEWGKCRADTRSSHTQHAHHIALDTEREGRVPLPIRPRAEPRLGTQLARPPWPPANHAHLAHVHLASRRVRLVEQASVLPPRPRNDRRRWPCPGAPPAPSSGAPWARGLGGDPAATAWPAAGGALGAGADARARR